MKYKIGVFGSAEGDIEKIIPKALKLGIALAQNRVIIITGATTGLPHEVAASAHRSGAELWGYSSEIDFESQKKHVPKSSIYSKLVYIPKDYEFAQNVDVSRKYRNVSSTANCDAGIIISGRWGTLNEFTNLYDFGKVVGVLTGTGGMADELRRLSKKIHKPGKAKVFFSNSPERLIKQVLEELKKR